MNNYKDKLSKRDRSKIILDVLFNYPKSIYFGFMVLFIIYDYLIYTNIYHLSNASFIEFYIYSFQLENIVFLMAYIFVPLSMIFIIYLMIYILTKSLIFLDKVNYNIKNILANSFYSIFILSCFYYLANFNIYLIFICLLLIVFLSTVFLYKFFFKNTVYSYLFGMTVLIIFAFPFHYENQFYITVTIIAILMILLSTFFKWLSKKTTHEDNINLKIVGVLSLFIIIMPIWNIFLWNSTTDNLKASSFNIVLNTSYLSTNNKTVTINTDGYTNTIDPNLNNICTIKNTFTLGASKNTYYLPLFQNSKLYFKESSDKNKTCVLIVQTLNERHILKDVGYISSNLN